jgi:hypothetical protein
MFLFTKLRTSFSSMLEFMISAFTNELMKYEPQKITFARSLDQSSQFFAAAA